MKSFTDEDIHAVTPNYLLLGLSRNSVPGAVYGHNDSLTCRQETIHEIEQTWWNQWIALALPQLVLYKR